MGQQRSSAALAMVPANGSGANVVGSSIPVPLTPPLFWDGTGS
ncbi:MAG: hypothetical protein ACRDJH_03155 [Thermomicrobiales bacterium]